MVEKIFVILGLVLFVNQLFVKWDVWAWFKLKGMKSKFEFFFKLSTCRFCLLFHVSWILTFIYSLFGSFGWDALVVPFVVSGLIQISFKNGL